MFLPSSCRLCYGFLSFNSTANGKVKFQSSTPDCMRLLFMWYKRVIWNSIDIICTKGTVCECKRNIQQPQQQQQSTYDTLFTADCLLSSFRLSYLWCLSQWFLSFHLFSSFLRTIVSHVAVERISESFKVKEFYGPFQNNWKENQLKNKKVTQTNIVEHQTESLEKLSWNTHQTSYRSSIV